MSSPSPVPQPSGRHWCLNHCCCMQCQSRTPRSASRCRACSVSLCALTVFVCTWHQVCPLGQPCIYCCETVSICLNWLLFSGAGCLRSCGPWPTPSIVEQIAPSPPAFACSCCSQMSIEPSARFASPALAYRGILLEVLLIRLPPFSHTDLGVSLIWHQLSGYAGCHDPNMCQTRELRGA